MTGTPSWTCRRWRAGCWTPDARWIARTAGPAPGSGSAAPPAAHRQTYRRRQITKPSLDVTTCTLPTQSITGVNCLQSMSTSHESLMWSRNVRPVARERRRQRGKPPLQLWQNLALALWCCMERNELKTLLAPPILQTFPCRCVRHPRYLTNTDHQLSPPPPLRAALTMLAGSMLSTAPARSVLMPCWWGGSVPPPVIGHSGGTAAGPGDDMGHSGGGAGCPPPPPLPPPPPDIGQSAGMKRYGLPASADGGGAEPAGGAALRSGGAQTKRPG